MKRVVPSFTLVVLLCAWILLNGSNLETSADNCTVATFPTSGCQGDDTGKCPLDCKGEGGSANGVLYSDAEPQTTKTVEDGGEFDKTCNVDCHKTVTCTSSENGDQNCVEGIFDGHECEDCTDDEIFNDECDGCMTYEDTGGNWQQVPSVKLKACGGAGGDCPT
jgi:hypothetical protein